MEQDFYRAAEDTLGGRLSLAREVAGLSVDDAARLVNVAHADWTAWETDRSAPEPHHVYAIAVALRISPAWLIAGRAPGPLPI